LSRKELDLDIQPKHKEDEEKRERAKKAKTKKEATKVKPISEQFDDIAQLKLDDKEYERYKIAREAFEAGEIGRLEDKPKLTKGEVMSMAAIILQKREEAAREERIKQVLANKPDNFHVLTKDDELPRFLKRLRQEVKLQMQEWKGRFEMLGVKSMTAGDFEGTGLDPYIDVSVGFSIWLPILNEGYYLAYGHVEVDDRPYGHKDSDPLLTRSKVLEAIVPYLSNADHGKTFHMGSARYDLHVAENEGYTIRGLRWDTLDAMYDMMEHLPAYGLKPLIDRYKDHIGIEEKEVFTFEDLFGNGSPAPYNTEIVGIYAIKDVMYGWSLFEWQFEIMKKTGRLLEMYADIDSKVPELDVFLIRSGFHIDLDQLRMLEEEFSKKIEQAKQDVITAYNIDDEFLYNMNMTINGKKIEDWLKKQRKKAATTKERLEKQRATIAECREQGKTHLKKYANALQQAEKYEQQLEELSDIRPEKYPGWIAEFEFTNNNHIGYLIYDFLQIEDKTPRVQRGKKRSTASDVLEMYYEDEESLKPLATVAEYEKLLNTYVRKIPHAMEIDGKFHSEFKAGGTSTGRYSSSEYKGRPIDVLKEFAS